MTYLILQILVSRSTYLVYLQTSLISENQSYRKILDLNFTFLYTKLAAQVIKKEKHCSLLLIK